MPAGRGALSAHGRAQLRCVVGVRYAVGPVGLKVDAIAGRAPRCNTFVAHGRLRVVMRWWGSLVALALGVSACAPGDSETSAEAYLDEVVSVIQEQALHADRIDWEHFAEAIDAADQAATTAETYPLVQELLAALGDGHSSLLTPDVVEALMDGGPGVVGDLPVLRMDGDIGYLQLPAWLLLPESRESQKYIAETAAGLDVSEACGWILDLRGNTGETCSSCCWQSPRSWVRESHSAIAHAMARARCSRSALTGAWSSREGPSRRRPSMVASRSTRPPALGQSP